MLQMKLPPSISVPSPPLSYSKDIKFYGVANATTQFNGSESRAKVRAPSAKQRDATGQPREGVKSDRAMPHTSASLNLGEIFLFFAMFLRQARNGMPHNPKEPVISG